MNCTACSSNCASCSNATTCLWCSAASSTTGYALSGAACYACNAAATVGSLAIGATTGCMTCSVPATALKFTCTACVSGYYFVALTASFDSVSATCVTIAATGIATDPNFGATPADGLATTGGMITGTATSVSCLSGTVVVPSATVSTILCT